MSQLAWKDEYSIGHFQTDQEHKGLVSLANKVIAFSNNGESINKIRVALKALSDYTQIHFRNEEAYMERIGYSELEKHKKCHMALKECLNGIVTQNASLDDLVRQLKHLMVVWVIEHIVNEDKKIVPAP